jgi:hypothetical protein
MEDLLRLVMAAAGGDLVFALLLTAVYWASGGPPGAEAFVLERFSQAGGS